MPRLCRDPEVVERQRETPSVDRPPPALSTTASKSVQVNGGATVRARAARGPRPAATRLAPALEGFTSAERTPEPGAAAPPCFLRRSGRIQIFLLGFVVFSVWSWVGLMVSIWELNPSCRLG